MVPFLIKVLMTIVPEAYMRGYEASYTLEEKSSHRSPWYESIISGLTLMMKVPYAFGICALVFFWEVISVVVNYNRLSLCVSWSQSYNNLSSMLFLHMFWIHVAGFFIALIGTRGLLAYCGERWSLVFVPLFTGIFLVGYFSADMPTIMIACYIMVRAVNYSLAISVREVLYIPTTKEVRFKTKSWVDAFGAKFARGVGSGYSLLMNQIQKNHNSSMVFCLGILFVWMVTAYHLGRRYEKAIKNNEVIG
jgi:AAA family ATP:ADP antiporter